MKNLVLFASGSGSNAEKIIEHFKGSDQVQITHIYCNNPSAGIIQRAERLGVPCRVFDRESYKNGTVLKEVQSLRTDWIILAGFLWLVPADFVKAFPQKIVNIHPALLPKCGGKGMMMDPNPNHPQHMNMKVVNHLVYVWSGYGNHSMWVWSLNICTRASCGAQQRPRISADFPNLDQQCVVITA